MKATKTMKAMAVVLAAVLMMSAMSFTVFADATLAIGTVTYAEDDTDYTFTVPYTASDEVEQVTILATVGGDTAPTPTQANIVYVNQEVKDADGYTFKVAKDKFSTETDTLYVRLGGTMITTAQEGSKAVEIASVTQGYKVTGYTIAGANVAIGEKSDVADDTGYFEIADVASGDHTVVITAKAAIARSIAITVGAADYAISSSADDMVNIFIGDVSGEGNIDNTDLNGIKGIFGKATGDATYNEAYDIDSSGLIDNTDLNTVKGAFGKSAASYN